MSNNASLLLFPKKNVTQDSIEAAFEDEIDPPFWHQNCFSVTVPTSFEEIKDSSVELRVNEALQLIPYQLIALIEEQGYFYPAGYYLEEDATADDVKQDGIFVSWNSATEIKSAIKRKHERENSELSETDKAALRLAIEDAERRFAAYLETNKIAASNFRLLEQQKKYSKLVHFCRTLSSLHDEVELLLECGSLKKYYDRCFD